MTIANQPEILTQLVKPTTDLRRRLNKLYQLVAPTWPLANAVACNPLQGLEFLPFAEAVREGRRLFDADCLPGFWQLRQALQNGGLKPRDFEEALASVLTEMPSLLSLGELEVNVPELLRDLLYQLDDAKDPKGQSPRLSAALPHLIKAHPWRNTLSAVNERCLPWLGAFLDEGQATWSMPYRERGFFPAVRTLLAHDRKLTGDQRAFLRSIPTDSLSALKTLLKELTVTEKDQDAFLCDHLLALPGWAAYIRWRSEQKSYGPQQQYTVNLTDYLAVRLLFAYLLPASEHNAKAEAPRELRRLSAWAENRLRPDSQTAPEDWAALLRVLQQGYHELRLALLRSWEEDFRQQLGDRLHSQTDRPADRPRPAAQLAFCIDVRSEPFRRQVEAAGDYETFGFAGFFGLPIAYETITGERVNSLPVLLQPAHQLREQARPECSHQVERHREGRLLLKELKQAYKSLKYNLATPFAAVEALGLPAGLITVGRSLAPEVLSRLRRRGRQLLHPEVDLAPDVEHSGEWGIPLKDQVTYAGNALRMMGLTRNFAPLVVLCGHGSQTENNPYAAALDCGACGGSHGGPNAAAMARILNQEEVRRRLRDQGIAIPADTLFLGAQHNTTTDEVRLLDLPGLDGEKRAQVKDLRTGLRRAQSLNLAVRAGQLGTTKPRHLLRRSADWSEVRPEWGLAGNAGFVVAPRHLTANLDLRGRCFLHSYDWQQDPEGASLEVILTAPLVVAQWINSQYFFSTVDNTAFGSGSKITHNVVGKVGVMQGNGSDLMHGLPLQSVMQSDDQLYHEPLRLMAMVVAPRSRVQQLIDKHDILQQMFFNEWVALQVYDPEEKAMWRLETTGEWRAV